MADFAPILWLVIGVSALFLLGFSRFARKRATPPPRFLEGMNATTALALAGAMLLALALLVDVYGSQWALGPLGEDLSLGLAGAGGLLVLLSFVVDRRSNPRS